MNTLRFFFCPCFDLDPFTAESHLQSERQINMTTSLTKKDSFRMFDAIAGQYDFVNFVLSLGLHARWRTKIRQSLPAGGQLEVLDLATGTGDVAIELARDQRVVHVEGLDMSVGMLEIGRKKLVERHLTSKINLIEGDAQAIPFTDNSFHAVSISFGIRNVPDVLKCMREALRVLKPGGRFLVLEFALPKSHLFRAIHLFYLRNILPHIGRMLSGHSSAYRYLNETIEEFPHGGEFLALMRQAGFKETRFLSLTFGIVNLYIGEKK